MSHFTVIVVGEDVHGQLAPYQENNMGDCPEEYMEFVDTTDYIVEKWNELPTSDGKTALVYKKPLKTPVENLFDGMKASDQDYEEVSEIVPEGHRYVLDEDYLYSYKDLKDFALKGFGREMTEDGRFGYYENPDAKWDWYQIGGRWNGFFKAKPGCKGERGEASLIMGDHKVDPDLYDIIKVGDIDFNYKHKEIVEQSNKNYDKAMDVFGDLPDQKPWDTFADLVDNGKMTIQEAREAYWDQPRMKQWKKMQDKGDRFFAPFAASPDDFLCTREEYINARTKGIYSPYAFVYNGEWISQGEMGWWGRTIKENMKDADWRIQSDNFYKYLLKEDPNTLLTLVDCHI